jgi:chromosome segregation ATPase
MDLKTRIRVALGIEEENTQLAYEGKLADGTIIVSEADALAEGVAINVLVEDGTQMPLPVGEYETEDGVKFIVEEEGVISSMEEEAEEEEKEMKDKDDEDYEDEKEEMSDANAELFAEIGAVVKELLEEVRGDIARLTSELDELRGENLAKDENIAELQEENTELSKQVKKLGEEPADNPVNLKKFKKEQNVVNLSSAEYNRLSRKEKYWYNLNK